MISIAMALVLAHASGVQPSIVPSQSIDIFDGIGACGDQVRRVDMRRVAFLENQSIDLGTGSTQMRIRIEGEKAYTQAIGTNINQPTHIHNVALDVQRNGDIDIQLKLAILDGQLLIYWRETFQHRMYRHGLLRPELTRLVPVCEGRGGFNSSE